MKGFTELIRLVAHLRSEDGCPWDKAQTHSSLKGMLLEETYEAVEAIEKEDFEGLKDELGDLLLHVAFHAQIAKENGEFTVEDVLNSIREKVIRRHPHVFAGKGAKDIVEIKESWEEIKRSEGKKTDLSEHLPALIAARKIQDRAANLGIDLATSIDYNPDDLETGIGQLLFRVVALARSLDVEPELALKRVTTSFAEEVKEV